MPLKRFNGVQKLFTTSIIPFEAADTADMFVPKEIIARRIQDICAESNKGRKADHYLVVWEGYPLKKDYTLEPVENLYGYEHLAQTYEHCRAEDRKRKA